MVARRRREGFVRELEREAFVEASQQLRTSAPVGTPENPALTSMLAEDALHAAREAIQRAAADRRPPFQKWADSITQKTVDAIARFGAENDNECLVRLRALGVIDERNRVVPVALRPWRAPGHEQNGAA